MARIFVPPTEDDLEMNKKWQEERKLSVWELRNLGKNISTT